MLGYVAFIALLNLGLGYALAVYLKTGALPTRRTLFASAESTLDSQHASFDYSHNPANELPRTPTQTTRASFTYL
jgi:hypothetical protein